MMSNATNGEILEIQSDNQRPKIFKVLKVIRDVEPAAYDPTIVSLGPYHHGKPSLQASNEIKTLLLKKLLDKGFHKNLDAYEKLVKESKEAWNMYSDNMCTYQVFNKMMLMDCVFVIMILWFWKNEGLEAIGHPIFTSGQRTLTVVLRDMLLLENQLPFSLLETLFNKAFPESEGRLKGWIRQFINCMSDEDEVPSPDNVAIHHILQLFYLCTVHVPNVTQASASEMASISISISSATRLKEAGIRFRRKLMSRKNLLDITFKKGVLEIPQFEVDDDTNITWRNLIALEQCHNNNDNITVVGNPFTAYVFFLSCIIHTAADVEILREKDIIRNKLGNNEEVAQLFTKICKEVVVDTGICYLAKVFKEVSEHGRSKWKTWFADLNHTHFRTPWSCISFVAGLLFFSITVMQLGFTIANYSLNLDLHHARSNGTSRL